ncbi:hypothetical protein SDC9_128985 [bioreactor metagenome]|uniref:Uncharacterized protein n=1 Tax=bioreactor metagenome TaxID=1076179 RepID=A0A645CYE4_9ZZZZ
MGVQDPELGQQPTDANDKPDGEEARQHIFHGCQPYMLADPTCGVPTVQTRPAAALRPSMVDPSATADRRTGRGRA